MEQRDLPCTLGSVIEMLPAGTGLGQIHTTFAICLPDCSSLLTVSCGPRFLEFKRLPNEGQTG
jgi:hypothetical protein